MISTISPLIQETIKYNVQAGGTPAIGILHIKKELDRLFVKSIYALSIDSSIDGHRMVYARNIGDMHRTATASYGKVLLLKDDAIQGAFSKRVAQALRSLQEQTGQLSSSWKHT